MCPRPMSHGTEFSNFFPCDMRCYICDVCDVWGVTCYMRRYVWRVTCFMRYLFLTTKSLVQASFNCAYHFSTIDKDTHVMHTSNLSNIYIINYKHFVTFSISFFLHSFFFLHNFLYNLMLTLNHEKLSHYDLLLTLLQLVL